MTIKSILGKQPDGTIQLTITIPWERVKKSYEEALVQITNETEVPGFRKGKAPLKIVEEKIDKSKVYERVIQTLIPQAYVEAIEGQKLKPILSPKVELLKAEENQDWEIRATTCEEPVVDLGNYRDEIRKKLTTLKLWVPGQGKPNEKKEDNQEEKTQKVIETLLRTAKVDLPDALVEDQLNRSLSNLINQTEKLGLTVDQYLASINKTTDQIRQEYKTKIEGDLKLQFILDAIIKSEKITIPEKEIEDLIASMGDEKLKADLQSPAQRAYIEHILARRKVLEHLSNL